MNALTKTTPVLFTRHSRAGMVVKLLATSCVASCSNMYTLILALHSVTRIYPVEVQDSPVMFAIDMRHDMFPARHVPRRALLVRRALEYGLLVDLSARPFIN